MLSPRKVTAKHRSQPQCMGPFSFSADHCSLFLSNQRWPPDNVLAHSSHLSFPSLRPCCPKWHSCQRETPLRYCQCDHRSLSPTKNLSSDWSTCIYMGRRLPLLICSILSSPFVKGLGFLYFSSPMQQLLPTMSTLSS